MKTTLAIAMLVSALLTTIAVAGNCTTTCNRTYNGQGYVCNTSCY